MLDQNLSIIYQNKLYMADSTCLFNASIKIKKKVEFYINGSIDIKKICLIIDYEQFSPRNIDNFLKICQNLPTDVQNSEVAEICEIALMFQAEEIYKTSINFIHNNIDSNFSIPIDKFDDDHFFRVELIEPALIHHVDNINDLEFDESYTQTEDTNNNEKNNNNFIFKAVRSVYYQIKIETSFMKCRRFYFYRGETLLFSAKQKIHQIFIADGSEIHIDDRKTKKRAIITQNNDGYNIVNSDDQTFKIIYVRTSQNQFKKLFSMRLSFIHCDKLVYWGPRVLKKVEQLNGAYNRKPIKSKKNALLQNKARHTTFIVRKMDKNLFEAECTPSLSPIIAFSIALSQIVGPFCV